MKKLAVFIALCILTSSVYAQIVEIPDVNFASWLEINFPDCMEGNMMDTQCESILNSTTLDCSSLDISDLTGIEHFTSLTTLLANFNTISELNLLPNTLINLEIINNNLNSINSFPPSMIKIDITSNESLVTIPSLPPTLQTLKVSSCSGLTSLPELPISLLEFRRDNTTQITINILPPNLVTYYASNCGLTAFPEIPESLEVLGLSSNILGNQTSFPDQLRILSISNTSMSELPEISENLTRLVVSNNLLTASPIIPETVTSLDISYNTIDSLFIHSSISALRAVSCGLDYINPFLPICRSLFISENNLTELPYLPTDFMLTLAFNDNQISCVNEFPNAFFGGIQLANNPFTCLPSISMLVNDMDLTDFPVCQENDPINNPNGCPSNSGFEGFIHLDEDEMCDFNEEPLANIPVKIGQDGADITYTNSLSNGRYLFQGELGEYNVGIQINNLPFTTNCLDPGLLQNVEIDAVTSYVTDLNFALRCNDDSDFGVQSVLLDGWVFPGQVHEVNVLAGEISQFYNAHCSDITDGEVTISINGPAEIYSVNDLSPVPTEVTDNSVTYELTDLTSVDLMTGFIFDLITYATATDQDQICLEITIESGSDNDLNLDNNYLDYCYQVVNSYDPNNKLVSPISVEPGFDDWMFYTINFQNTGSAPAFNIRLEDELPANMDLETFQMTNTSHDSYYDINELDLTVYYPNIMLADSTSNEPDSKGYFQFKLKPLTPMIDGETIENTASIFFDFNDPVITNTAITEALLPENIREYNTSSLNIFPNPSKGNLSIVSNDQILEIKCYNILGKEIPFEQTKTGNKAHLTLKDNNPGIVIIETKTANGISRNRLIVE